MSIAYNSRSNIEVIEIRVKVTTTHTSDDVQIQSVDGHATLIDLGGIQRIIYQEEDGALTTLDVGESWVQFKRQSEWLTHAVFHEFDQNKLYVISEEGELRFDIKVLRLEINDQEVSIDYNLLQGNESVGTHQYTCKWTEEEESWLEIH